MVESPPYESYQWSPEYMDKGDWVRVSFCLQGAEPTVYEQEHYISSIGQKSYRDRPEERKSLRVVNSIDELEAEMSVPSYYWDGEWLHLKDRVFDRFVFFHLRLCCITNCKTLLPHVS